MNQLEERLKKFRDYTTAAYDHIEHARYEDALTNLRKGCEAICRIYILKNSEQSEAIRLINQHTSLRELIDLLVQRGIRQPVCHRLEDIRYGGNSASHDPRKVNKTITPADVTLCRSQYREVIRWLYDQVLQARMPRELSELLDERQPAQAPAENSPWQEFKCVCRDFSPQNDYLLIAPPSIRNCTRMQLENIANDIWGLVFDFNPDSKTNGLLCAAGQNDRSREIRTITIQQRNDLLVSNNNFITNWVMANGLRNVENTVTEGEMQWRSPQPGYPHFIEQVLAKYFSQRTRRTVVVFLWDDAIFTRFFLEKITERISPDLIHYVLTSSDDERLLQLKEQASAYASVCSYCRISINEMVAGFEQIVAAAGPPVSCLQVPGRVEETDCPVDISPIYAQCCDAGVEPIYIGIEREEETQPEHNFYTGDRISWKDLSMERDVRRSITSKLIQEIGTKLRNIRESEPFVLMHHAGAGGSTLARRIALNFHDEFPTVIITRHCRFKERTLTLLHDFAARTQKTILAVVEASNVNQNELYELIRKSNQAAKRILFLYVKHAVHKGADHLLRAGMEDTQEQLRFIEKFQKIALNPKNIAALAAHNPTQCEVIDFALSANEMAYNAQALGNYIHTYLDRLPNSYVNRTANKQRDFAIFAALQYYYTQKPVSEVMLRSLFSAKGLSHDLESSPEEEYLRKLLTQEYDRKGPTEYWRPRYNRFALEILRIGLTGKVPDASTADDWMSLLSDWAVKYIECCKENNPILTDEIEGLLRSLFLERNNEDLLEADEKKRFARIIDDIRDVAGQSAVLETLVKHYPENHHFRGHWARFLYEMANDIPDYDRAAEQIEYALRSGSNDYILWHLGGMCRKRRISFLIERYKTDEEFRQANPDIEMQIQDLTEVAFTEYFNKSRSVYARNLYVHTAAIGMLLDVLDFGRYVQGNPSKEDFLADKENWWYSRQFEKMFELLDEAKYIVEESTSLDSKGASQKNRQMIRSAEGRIYELIGDYSKSIDIFGRLAEMANATMRPYYRKLFVYSNLLSKVDDRSKLHLAWGRLNRTENAALVREVEKNITDQPDNVGHIKDWMRLVRYSKDVVSFEVAIAKIQRWYEQCSGLSKAEAAYYLYVLNACNAICAGDSFNRYNVNESRRFLAECRQVTSNDYHSFEWLGRDTGMRSIISHKDLSGRPPFFNFMPSKTPLRKVKGVITHMENNRKGTIQLECGLEAYFVPVVNNMILGRDETLQVECFISFRYSGIQAWNVKSVTERDDVRDVIDLSDDARSGSYDYEGENVERPNPVPDMAETAPVPSATPRVEPQVFETERPAIGLKILGKIDPELLKKKR
ncbi:hypothetical protein [Alistipes sp.]|uniref:P-loop NTPase n=1 Tax=Alistipes sp. TaxID=1872444 RepID=UPI003AF10206